MNDQEKALHIRDMLRAEFDGETIMYSSTGTTGIKSETESNGFGSRTGNMQHLLEYPERYSKKEPEFIYENVYSHIEDEDEDEVRFYTYTYSKKASALKAAEEFPDRLVVVAHPIALPEGT